MTMHRRRLFALPLVALLGGCATKYEGSFNPAFLQRAAPAHDTRAPVRVALWVRPTVHDAVHEGASGSPAQNMRLHLGRIVEEAMASALADVAQGGVQRVAGAAPATGVAATVEIEAVRVSHDRKLSWMLPIPVFPFAVGDTDFFSQLAFDVSLLDAEGRAAWTRSYDGGRETWKRPSFWSNEPLPVGLTRMAHETASRLSQQVVADLRDWLAAERNKAREL